MTCGATDRSRVPINKDIITHWYWLSSVNCKPSVWCGLGRWVEGRVVRSEEKGEHERRECFAVCQGQDRKR
jgi:hypothetical protein